MGIKKISSRVLELLKTTDKGILEFNDIVKKLKVDQSLLMRSILELQKEELVKLQESDRIEIRITKEGEKAIREGLPECILVEILKNNPSMHISDISLDEKNIAIAWAKKKNLIEINKGFVKLIRECNDKDKKEIETLKNIGNKEYYSIDIDNETLEMLKKRKFIEVIPKTVKYVKITEKGMSITLKDEEESIKEITPDIIINELWRGKSFKRYNVKAPSYKFYGGKKHYVTEVIEYIRNIWLDMGFEEMKGNLMVSAFWNFDALFVPQNHPAREMQDTFYVSLPFSPSLPNDVLSKVREMHEKGDGESIGWGYEYREEKAKEWVLRTHTTVLSALTLYNLKIEDLPKKYFSIGKVFRNETLDWKHLFEFYQVEGIVVGKGLNFRHLLGYLKTFFSKMGYDNIRIRPAYFPYTEMSVEVEVMTHKNTWMELGGAGIFRPEVVKPLLGEDIPVLAWGLGLERIIMNYYDFKDIRDTYTTNLHLLRNTKRFWV